jgi:hypothetical protein
MLSRREWSAVSSAGVLATAALASVAFSWIAWPAASEYSFRGHLLAKARPDAPALVTGTYFGLNFPNYEIGRGFLARAEARGLYRAREVALFTAGLRDSTAPPAPGRQGGAMESLTVAGPRLAIVGWTELPASFRGRSFTAHSAEVPRSSALDVHERTDIAVALRRPDLLFAGFRWEGQYESEAQARRAARDLCLLVEAPGYPPSALLANAACGPVRENPTR